MNINVTLKSDDGWYDVRLTETKDADDINIDARNFKIYVGGLLGDSSKIQKAKIDLSQLKQDQPATLRKVYATILDTIEEIYRSIRNFSL